MWDVVEIPLPIGSEMGGCIGETSLISDYLGYPKWHCGDQQVQFKEGGISRI